MTWLSGERACGVFGSGIIDFLREINLGDLHALLLLRCAFGVGKGGGLIWGEFVDPLFIRVSTLDAKRSRSEQKWTSEVDLFRDYSPVHLASSHAWYRGHHSEDCHASPRILSFSAAFT